MQKYYSNGKLLITGEYVVLDGALSLALPTKFGQTLQIEAIHDDNIIWESFDDNGIKWFESKFEITTYGNLKSIQNNNDVSERIIQIFDTVKTLNPDFLIANNGFKISTHLTFPRNWGLGTSSTLINNMAQWANVDAYKLLEKTFGGSAYDIACAQNNFPLTYQLNSFSSIQSERSIKKTNFNPVFKEHIFFVYLNKKQNSRDGIASYKANKGHIHSAVSEINDITTKIIQSKSLSNFENLITEHETIISKIIKQQPVKELLFKDFKGGIKSLGAWGGDFVMVTSKENPSTYFKNKGYQTIIPYLDMVL